MKSIGRHFRHSFFLPHASIIPEGFRILWFKPVDRKIECWIMHRRFHWLQLSHLATSNSKRDWKCLVTGPGERGNGFGWVLSALRYSLLFWSPNILPFLKQKAYSLPPPREHPKFHLSLQSFQIPGSLSGI